MFLIGVQFIQVTVKRLKLMTLKKSFYIFTKKKKKVKI